MDFCRSKGWSTHLKMYICFLSTSNSSHSVQFFNFFFQKIPSLDIAIKKLRDAGHFRAPTLNSTLPHSSFHPLTLITRAFYNERNSRPFSLALALSLSFGISIKIIHKFFLPLFCLARTSYNPWQSSAFGVRWFGRTIAALLNEKRINKRRELLALSRHSYNSAKVHKRVKGKEKFALLGRWRWGSGGSEKWEENTQRGNYNEEWEERSWWTQKREIFLLLLIFFFYFFLCVGGSRRLKSIRWL